MGGIVKPGVRVLIEAGGKELTFRMRTTGLFLLADAFGTELAEIRFPQPTGRPVVLSRHDRLDSGAFEAMLAAYSEAGEGDQIEYLKLIALATLELMDVLIPVG